MPHHSPHPPRHHLRPRTRGIALLAVSAGLVPWTAMLWHQLPRHGHSTRSRNWWVTLDASEAVAFGAAGYLHLIGDRRQIPVLRLIAALLVLDAAADVSLAHNGRERAAAFLMLPVEVATAAWCLRVAHFAHYELLGYDTEKHAEHEGDETRRRHHRVSS